MARKTLVQLTDDIDGKKAAETVSFGLDGVEYEIDLHGRNAARLRKDVEKWAGSARRVGGRKRRRADGGTREYDPKAVRRWAESKKIEVPARGRIPGDVIEKFRAAGN